MADNDNDAPSEKNEPVITDPTPDAEETDSLQSDLEKAKKDLLYLQADFENYKKRILKERSDLVKYGAEAMVRAFLDLLDNFERAMSVEIKPENLKSFADGIAMISSEFKNVLNRFGVTEVPALGQAFDPNIHEAMGTEVSADVKPGYISKVFTKPYKLHDRIIRHGRVVVAEAPKDNKPK